MFRAFALALLAIAAPALAHAGDYGPVADCEPGVDCFLQQMADMAPGPDVRDPFCGSASYDTHDGIDLRVRSMRDVERGVPVTAMAAGQVNGIRDGMADKMAFTRDAKVKLATRQCGNGVSIALDDGREVQYCHMRRGSIAVGKGDRVEKGAVLGMIGASGLAEFPHVHVRIRDKDGVLDLMTGRRLTEGCDPTQDSRASLFEPDYAAKLGNGDATLLDAGIAGAPMTGESLSMNGSPPPARSTDRAVIGWAWYANLKANDRIAIRLTGPAGEIVAEVTSKPLDRNKAIYLSYAGKRAMPKPGRYDLDVRVIRSGEILRTDTRSIDVR